MRYLVNPEYTLADAGLPVRRERMAVSWDHALFMTLVIGIAGGLCAYSQRAKGASRSSASRSSASRSSASRVLSLWLVPPEPVRSQMCKEMRAIATQYGLPIFEPHVTIVGHLGSLSDKEVLVSLEALRGTGHVPVRFDLGGVVSGRDPGQPAPWHQSAVAVVHNKTAPALGRLQQRAKQAFLGQADAPVAWVPPINKPHLSLAYVESSLDSDRSAELCKALTVPDRFTGAEVAVVEVSRAGASEVLSACRRGEWREVGRVQL